MSYARQKVLFVDSYRPILTFAAWKEAFEGVLY
jgi:hypothetical protein